MLSDRHVTGYGTGWLGRKGVVGLTEFGHPSKPTKLREQVHNQPGLPTHSQEFSIMSGYLSLMLSTVVLKIIKIEIPT